MVVGGIGFTLGGGGWWWVYFGWWLVVVGRSGGWWLVAGFIKTNKKNQVNISLRRLLFRHEIFYLLRLQSFPNQFAFH